MVKERPYVRYVREAEKEILTFGRNNPTFASSQAEGRLPDRVPTAIPLLIVRLLPTTRRLGGCPYGKGVALAPY